MSLVPEVFCDRCGFCHPDHEDWRAILARDVADVERYCQELDDGYDDDPDVLAHMPTCAAWLARARAAL